MFAIKLLLPKVILLITFNLQRFISSTQKYDSFGNNTNIPKQESYTPKFKAKLSEDHIHCMYNQACQ